MLSGHAASTCCGIFTGSLALDDIFFHVLAAHQPSGLRTRALQASVFSCVCPALTPSFQGVLGGPESRPSHLGLRPSLLCVCLPSWIVCCICLLTSCLVFITANRGGKRWSYFIPRAFSLTQPHLSFAVPVLTHPFPYLRLCPLISSSFVLFSSARQQ